MDTRFLSNTKRKLNALKVILMEFCWENNIENQFVLNVRVNYQYLLYAHAIFHILLYVRADPQFLIYVREYVY